MTAFDKLSNAQKIRASIHRDVRAISSEACHFLGLEVTAPAKDIIAELVYKKLTVYGADLEAFAKHAKRTVINSEDVKLLARRNPSLLSRLNSIAPATNTSATKRKKTKQQETPANAAEENKNKDDTNANKEETSKLTEETPKDKNSNVDYNIEDAFVEDMIVDGTIDLTFE